MKIIVFLKIFWRSFFIQSCWNYKSLLSVGFSYAILPVAEWLYNQNPDQYKAFVKRHIGFFNGHPYFIPFALGSIMRLEEDLANGKGSEDQILNFKEALIGPLGALGDQLFWARIKPAVFSFGTFLFLIFEDVSARILILVLVFMLFNIPHIWIRIYGLSCGYREGFEIFKYLKIEKFSRLSTAYTILGILSISGIIGIIVSRHLSMDPLILVILFASMVVSYLLKFKYSKSYLAIILPLVIAILTGILNQSI